MATILIIEDHKDVNRVLAEALTDADYKVKSVYTGSEGIEEIKNNAYDLILLDIMLPYKSGDEILKETRTFSEVPVIIISAKEYMILELLLKHPGKVFTKVNLYETIWQDEYLGDDNAIKTHISNLRHKLKTISSNEEYIETVWGFGYRLYKN